MYILFFFRAQGLMVIEAGAEYSVPQLVKDCGKNDCAASLDKKDVGFDYSSSKCNPTSFDLQIAQTVYGIVIQFPFLQVRVHKYHHYDAQ